MRLKTGIDSTICSGCGSCVQGCPFGALALVPDEDGFIIPKTDENACTDCGLCQKICPSVAENISNIFNMPISANSFAHGDDEILSESTSGGAFTAIVQAFGAENCSVFGAKSISRSEVAHARADSLSEISAFRKSKYAQSNTVDSFVQAKKILKDGGRVLFSGTPCQIAGLRLFLRKDYENLLCVEVACHGISNSKFTEEYLSDLEKNAGKKIVAYTFRNKAKKLGQKSSSFSKITYDDGSVKMENRDILMRGFIKFLSVRTSCLACPFSRKERVSDFTIADFWGAFKYDSSLDPERGYSLVCANTLKAQTILQRMNAFGEIRSFDKDAVLDGRESFSPKGHDFSQREKFILSVRKIGMLNSLNAFVKKASIFKRGIYFALRPLSPAKRNKILNFLSKHFGV